MERTAPQLDELIIKELAGVCAANAASINARINAHRQRSGPANDVASLSLKSPRSSSASSGLLPAVPPAPVLPDGDSSSQQSRSSSTSLMAPLSGTFCLSALRHWREVLMSLNARLMAVLQPGQIRCLLHDLRRCICAPAARVWAFKPR